MRHFIVLMIWLIVNTVQCKDHNKDKEYIPDVPEDLRTEGDIVITQQFESEKGELRNAAKNGGDIGLFDALNRGKWPKGIVPYTIARGHEGGLKKPIDKAIKIYNKALGNCVQWKYYKESELKRLNMKHYIIFFQGQGCYSMLGRQQSGPQKLSLQVPGCTRSIGTTVHEMMHALGFFHEQSRLDRDNYIYINFNNISPRMRYNFEKYRPGQASTLNAPYDTGSVMHYGQYAFSANGEKTIVSRNGKKLGQRKGLSKIDIQQLRKYYNCKGTGSTSTGTTTTTGNKTEKPKCKDEYSRCNQLREKCSTSWVGKYCQKTCRLCSSGGCRDKKSSCRSWKSKGYCNSSRYYKYMGKNCKKSCGKC